MTNCPFCLETIQDNSKKCRFCGEWIDKEISRKNEQEYIDLSSNMRHYGNIRFAGLTIFLATTAVLLNFIFSSNISYNIKTVLKIFGILICFLFLARDISDMYLWTMFIQRAADIERNLNFKQYSRLKGAPKFTFFRPAAIAIFIFYIFVVVFWFILLFTKTP